MTTLEGSLGECVEWVPKVEPGWFVVVAYLCDCRSIGMLVWMGEKFEPFAGPIPRKWLFQEDE